MTARRILVRGVVQGVGFRPFVYRLAQAHAIRGWVLNEETGVEIHAEAPDANLDAFIDALTRQKPAAAVIGAVEVANSCVEKCAEFTIRESRSRHAASTRISPDLPVCERCLAEMFDPSDRRYRYPYINCTDCGPRFTIVEGLPYDRARTTMHSWPMDACCEAQYRDPRDRRFHAQPLACPECGPHYRLESGEDLTAGDEASIRETAIRLRAGEIIAIKGVGGYHLSCDAYNAETVLRLRKRKFRKEKPFAVMARSIEDARALVEFSKIEQELLASAARLIVLAKAKSELPGVAPGMDELGVMLPYAPLHHLLFEAGAPRTLVMTSGNRSSEPIAYKDDDARRRLEGLADAILVGERPIARRVDDSVARVGAFGPMILRRSRGFAPGVVAEIPESRPILAAGADLKSAVTLVVEGQAMVSQHIGDLDHHDARLAFQETIRDLLEMYNVSPEELVVIHDLHPQYVSTLYAQELPACETQAVQHHRAHIASVMAEHQEWERRAVGVSFDGTGYGDDGTVWGGEFFTGSMSEGWTRSLHLRTARLPGGDSAARFPVQCAAGFLSQLPDVPDLTSAPFHFPQRYSSALKLVERGVRAFETSSVGRLFDTLAALLGFTREITYEGQAAMWLESLARKGAARCEYEMPLDESTLDFRPALQSVIKDRVAGAASADIARSFHLSLARAAWRESSRLANAIGTDLVILSGGVFQNQLLLSEIRQIADRSSVEIWVNTRVPPNDGGISLGQAASVRTPVH